MSLFVGSDEKRRTTTLRHNWRIEIFSEFGEDPCIKAHREQVEYDDLTGEAIKIKKDRVLVRNFSELLQGQQTLLSNLSNIIDLWEQEENG